MWGDNWHRGFVFVVKSLLIFVDVSGLDVMWCVCVFWRLLRILRWHGNMRGKRESEESKFWTVNFLVWKLLGFCRLSWSLGSFVLLWLWVLREGWWCWVFSAFKSQIFSGKLQIENETGVFPTLWGVFETFMLHLLFLEVFCFSTTVGFTWKVMLDFQCISNSSL
jgi:hypothetical protein